MATLKAGIKESKDFIICNTVIISLFCQTSSDDSHSQKVVVTGSIHPSVPVSPPTDQQSPAQQQDPIFHAVEECNTDASAQDSRQHQDNGLVLDAACIKVCERKRNIQDSRVIEFDPESN